MLDTFRKVLALLSRRERFQLALLFVAVVVMAFLELVSVAAILPFLAVAADPAQVHANAWLAWAYDLLGFTSAHHFLIALGGAALLALVLSNAWMMATAWGEYRFAHGRMHSLGLRLLSNYAAQPYVFFLRRNSADLGKNVLQEVEVVTVKVVLLALRLLAKTMVALAIIGLLIAFDPTLALLVTLVLGGAYGSIYYAVRHRLARLGAERLAANTARYQATSELFGAMKDVKLLGKEAEFTAAFAGPSARFARNRATAEIISDLPRFALEAIAFGGVLLIALYLLARGGNLQQVLPVLGLYAFAGYRLMPNLQLIFRSATQLRFSAPAVHNLYRELIETRAPAVVSGNGRTPEPMALARRLELEGVTFTYPGAHRPALEDVSLAIEANSTVGILGPTGSGKTTLVDVILGLLRPNRGEIRIDGVPLADRSLRAWQAALGYVPQHIYLADDSIARNIAFGVPAERIDMDAVRRAAAIANIDRFIAEELPGGYATLVGERGVRLSGGQRQRVGIARAVYHDPSLLVLDEATSSLDDATEAAVMEAIEGLAGSRTIIIIAHRLSTLRACDALHRLENGRIVDLGHYAELIRTRVPARAAQAP